MKSKLLFIFGALIGNFLIAMCIDTPAQAYLTGTTTVSSQITATRTPTITGTIHSWCDDVAIGITTSQSNDTTYFFSDYGEVYLNSGYWSLDLGINNFGLINGVYDIVVISECGWSGTYADPFYADVHLGVVSVVPSSCDSLCVPVYRFYNTVNGAHFYTTNEYEKRLVLNDPQYRFEGIATYAKYFRSAISGMVPVHRFYNTKQGVHFYTASQTEASNVNSNQSDTYRYEGVSYYTYASPVPSSTQVHRFYKFKQGVHFYTASQTEASNVNSNQSNTYRYEGVSYYNLLNI